MTNALANIAQVLNNEETKKGKAKTAAKKAKASNKPAPAVTTVAGEIVAILEKRNSEVSSNDTVQAIANVKRDERAINALFERDEFKEIKDKLFASIAIADKKLDRNRFVAVKTLIKVFHCMGAIVRKSRADLDPYSRVIVENLIALNGMSNKSNLVSLSKSVEYDEFEQTQALVKRGNCSVGTAGAQAGSTRMMLRELGICSVSKGKTGDVMSFQDNDRARALIAVFQA